MSARRHKEEGHALLLAIFVLFLLGMSLSLSVLGLQLRMRDQRRQASALRLEMMVDAAVAQTRAALAAEGRYAGFEKTDFGAGRMWSEVERLANGQIRIEASASLGARERGARLTLGGSRGPITSWSRNVGGTGLGG